MFADGASTTTKMVSTDDGRNIPAIYGEFLEGFSKAKVGTHPPHWLPDHAIDLEPGYILLYGWIYNPSEFKLRTWKAYIMGNLANRLVQWSSSLVEVPIHIAKQNNGGLTLCVNYCGLNKLAVNNHYPILLIFEIHDHACKAKIYRNLDLDGAYNLIWIEEGEKYKKAFWKPSSQFEYQDMAFGQTNTLATFKP